MPRSSRAGFESDRYDQLPPDAVAWAKVGILDTVGVTLGGRGSGLHAYRLCCCRTHSAGPALLFGSRRCVAPLDAALVNGTAVARARFRRLQQQHGRPPVGARAAGAVRAGRDAGVCRRDFIAAYIAGFETEMRIARARQFPSLREGLASDRDARHIRRGAAAAKLLGLDAEQTATALSLAASLASGIKANFGTMTKPLHVGHASRNGLIAALLAADGFTAGASAFEHGQGFFLVFNGAGNFSAEAVLAIGPRRWTSSSRASPSSSIPAAAAPIPPSTPCWRWSGRTR